MRPLRPTTLAEFARRAGRSPLVADPETKWSYSMGLDVLAAVVEKASGQSFQSFVQTRLFDPLGMTSSYWQVPAGEAGRLAAAYAYVGDQAVPISRSTCSRTWRRMTLPSIEWGSSSTTMILRGTL